MKVLNLNKALLLSSCLLVTGAAFAQTKGSATDNPTAAPGEHVVNDKWKVSMTNDGAYDKVKHVGAPIPWQYIREADILWKRRVWRVIDVYEKQNIAFRYRGDENTGGGMFIEILLDAVKSGDIAAYSSFNSDDRFTEKLTKDQILQQVAPKADTIEQEDADGNKITKISYTEFDPASVVAYRVKEDWMFDRNQGKMVVRIIGIAPLREFRDENGNVKGIAPMFWLYYPDIRKTLASYETYNPNNEVARISWDEFFESRQFSSKIYKVSNSLDQRYEDIYGNDQRGKMEALYQAQQDADEIFNKEHDMWIY
ncbi:MAG: gliding motility protein GldN [Chitinophagia bacterium]|nr:gliding motility protein GldN [Chitinophagia bacterium]